MLERLIFAFRMISVDYVTEEYIKHTYNQDTKELLYSTYKEIKYTFIKDRTEPYFFNIFIHILINGEYSFFHVREDYERDLNKVFAQIHDILESLQGE